MAWRNRNQWLLVAVSAISCVAVLIAVCLNASQTPVQQNITTEQPSTSNAVNGGEDQPAEPSIAQFLDQSTSQPVEQTSLNASQEASDSIEQTSGEERVAVAETASSGDAESNSELTANTTTRRAEEVQAEVQRKAEAVIPQAETPSIQSNANYQQDVLLVTVEEGVTVDQFNQQLAEKNIQNIVSQNTELVVDGLLKIRLVPGTNMDEVKHDLERTGIAKAVQPNYIYQTAEELTEELATESNATDSNGAVKEMDTNQPSAQATDAPSTSEPNDQEAVPTTVEHDTSSVLSTHDDNSAPSPITNVETNTTYSVSDLVNDTRINSQWGLDSMDVGNAWSLPALQNATSKVGVAVIDTGFETTHEDLVDNIVNAYDTTTGRVGNEYVLPNNSYNARHGTHVAGIVGATSNNGKGISGVGNNHLQLMLLRLYNDETESMSTEDMAKAYEYLIEHKDEFNIHVVNMSLGLRAYAWTFQNKDDAVFRQVDKAYEQGIVSVASAGNTTSDRPAGYYNYPSDYETIVSVMNLQNTVTGDPKSVDLWSTSNYNGEYQDSKNISAPGASIVSTVPTNTYTTMNGTSMASPMVAGVVGLMYTANPNLTAPEAKSILYNTARDIGDEGWDARFGYGEADAAKAVDAATARIMEGPEYLVVGATATYAVNSTYLGDWTFTSSDPSVVQISTEGSATARAVGVVSITATNNNDSTLTTTREVKVVGSMLGNRFVARGGSETLSVDAPSELEWDWSSSNNEVATVTNNGITYGHAVGNATITARLRADQSIVVSQDVTVYDSLKENVYLPVGRTTTLDLGEQLIGVGDSTKVWASQDPAIATVNENGEVTGVASGGAVVTCTVSKDSESQTIVWPVYVYGPIEGASKVGVGQSTTLSIAGWGYLSEEQQTGWTWSLAEGSSTTVATVDNEGVVTGKSLGTVTVTVTKGSGQDQLQFSHDVEVAKTSIAAATVSIPSQTYSGTLLTPMPTVVLGGTTLVANRDYAVQYANTINVGTYSVTITGQGIYDGNKVASFVIVPKQIPVPKAVSNLTYNGKTQMGVTTSDAYYSYSGTYQATNAGSYTAIASLKDTHNYQWTTGTSQKQTIGWQIRALPIDSSGIGATKPADVVYNGTAQTPRPTVTYGTTTLREGTDYTLSYRNNVSAGTATVTITGKGNFSGSRTTTFAIVPLSIKTATITGVSTMTYTGKPITPKPQLKVGGRTLREGSDYTLSYKNNVAVGTASVTVTGKGNYKDAKSTTFRIVNPSATVAYRTHVQDDGWQDWMRNGAMSGTQGRSLRLEGINIKLEGQPYSGGIEYRTHVQNIGWQNWVSNGVMSGTSGLSLRLEAIQIRLTGAMAANYDVWYCVHAQNVGWMGWAKNGERAGTATYSYRLEGIKILVLPKGSAAPGSTDNAFLQRYVGYVGHVQNIGWQGMSYDGEVAGTSGLGLRVEAFTMALQQPLHSGSIQYRSHVQNIGWEGSWKSDGAVTGTNGRGLRVEALQVRLTGEMANHYDVWYRVHAQNFGWLGWAKNGASAGTEGFAYRIEACQVVLVSKGGNPPGSTSRPFVKR